MNQHDQEDTDEIYYDDHNTCRSHPSPKNHQKQTHIIVIDTTNLYAAIPGDDHSVPKNRK